MKEITVKHVSEFKYSEEESWSSLLSHKIDCINWDEYPYQPEVAFRIVHDGTMLYIKYDVIENHQPRASNTKDQDPVWQDSCVEFFLRDKKGLYHNFEFNSKGVCLSASGKKRTDRIPRNTTDLQSIIRCKAKTKKLKNQYHWTLTIGIPFALLGLVSGEGYAANFYKCGDNTEEVHFLSWNKIDTPNPDFHCPKFFGTIVLE